jgi:alpha-beta hydrolase superfamily lysophospholipase
MAGESSFFEARGGWRLHLETWHAVETRGGGGGGDDAARSPAAHAVFLHGVNESSQTLTCRRLGAAFAAAGVSFHALEQHGHGLSLERRGEPQPLGLIEVRPPSSKRWGGK